jgi:hypothetical protein
MQTSNKRSGAGAAKHFAQEGGSSEVRHPKRFGGLKFALASVLLVALLLAANYALALCLEPYGGVTEVTWWAYRQAGDELDTVFVGNSRTDASVDVATFDEEAGYDDAIAFATTPRLPVQRRAERQKGQEQRARTPIKRRDLVLIAIVAALVVVLAVVAITFFGALNSNAELAETTNRAVDVPEQPVPQGMPSKSPPNVQVDTDQPVAESPAAEGGLVRMQGDVGVGEQTANEHASYVDGREVFPQSEAAESDAATPNGY